MWTIRCYQEPLGPSHGNPLFNDTDHHHHDATQRVVTRAVVHVEPINLHNSHDVIGRFGFFQYPRQFLERIRIV